MEPGGGEGTLKEVREGEDECVIQLVYVQETLPLPPRRVMSKDRHMPHVCAFTSLRVYKKILPSHSPTPSPQLQLSALTPAPRSPLTRSPAPRSPLARSVAGPALTTVSAPKEGP